MRGLLLVFTVLTLSSISAWSEESPTAKNGALLHYSMAITGQTKSSVPSNVIKAACTGGNTCCCRAGSQIFCTTPQQCSQNGGACSAGCN